jgi:PAS domain S-box-containing protein
MGSEGMQGSTRERAKGPLDTIDRSYLRLMDHVRDGVLLLQEGIVVRANEAARQMLHQDTLTGRSLADLFADGSRPVLEMAIASSGDDPIGPLPLLTVAGRVDVNVVRIPLQDTVLHQVMLHEHGPVHSLNEARTRSRMAEEVNQVLRQEIAQHRRTQDQLRQSRRFARSLVDSSLDMIIAVDREGRITEFNPAAVVKFGHEADEVLGRSASMLYADEREYLRVQSELDTHGAFAGEVLNKDGDGRAFTCFLAASRLYDEDGGLLGSMGVSRDITRAKLDEQALRASEERYRDLFENATDLIQSVDMQGRFQYANAMWFRTLDRTPDELSGLSVAEVVHADDLERYKAWCEELLAGAVPRPIAVRFLARGGRVVHVDGGGSVRTVNGGPVAIRSIFRDVTPMIEAQAAARRQEAKLRALFESGDHLFWTVDRRIALTSFNRGYADMVERLHGSRPELNTDPQRPRKQFASDGYHAFWDAKYAEAFAGKAIRFETDLIDRQGVRVCNEVFLSPVFDASGKVIEVFGIGHEVTGHKAAEDTVRAQAARLAAIFNSSANMMIWTLDRDMRITAFNEHFRSSARQGMDIDLALGDDFIAGMMDRVADLRYKPFVERYQAALAGEPQQFEVELRNRAGRPLWVENFLNPVRVNGEVLGISCLAHGITDKKEAQKKLLESLHEKEVLLKEVHHRVKNNLQIISSILNLQTGYVGDDPRMLELLRDSQGRIRSMSFIHESLYQNKNFSSIDLAGYIDGLSRNLMLSYSLTGKVDLVKDLEPVQLGLDQAIPCGLILNELISNALKHAFPDGRQGLIWIGLRTKGRTVTIQIADDGRGLPSGFDEKRDANLGLELVHTLIGQLDGRIERTAGTGVAYLITFELPK